MSDPMVIINLYAKVYYCSNVSLYNLVDRAGIQYK